jgi:hypothetical protein
VYFLDGSGEFEQIYHEDLWVYNKLQLSRSLGYNCGPIGTSVPKPDFYIVRPSINFLGMGRFARIEWIENTTDSYHPGEFWCEIFKGEHLSVDFKDKKANLVVRGIKKEDSPLYKWEKWEKIDKKVDFPEILEKLKGNYEWINCEFIGNKLIEVHFRQNPDFRYGNSVAIPIWKEDNQKNIDNLEYIEDSDYKRKGFYIK